MDQKRNNCEQCKRFEACDMDGANPNPPTVAITVTFHVQYNKCIFIFSKNNIQILMEVNLNAHGWNHI